GVDQTFVNSGRLDLDFDTKFATKDVVSKRCLTEPACKAAFLARLEEALDVFEGADLVARAEAIRDRIAADVAADPRKEGSVKNFEDGVAATIAFIQSRPAALRALLDALPPDAP